MIKIAYIIPNIEVGGTEKQLLSLVKNIDKNRFSPVLITTAGGGTLYDFFKSLIPVFILGGDKYEARKNLPKNPLAHLKTIKEMVALLNVEKPQFVHAYLPAANVLGPITARLANKPHIIVSKRSLSDYKKSHPFLSCLEFMGNFFSDLILANSIAVKKEVERTESFCKNKIEVVYNGVEVFESWDNQKITEFRKKEDLPENAVLAVCVSNFFAYKGHQELVKAASLLKKDFPLLIYLLIGRDAGNMEASKKLAKELGVDDKFKFLGVKSNVMDFMRASDIFIHPSRQEGFSNSILEAMSSGLPVLACDVGGNCEAVTDSITGKLVPKESSEALAGAIFGILKEPAKMKEMGSAGRKKAVEFFSVGKMVSDMENIYIKFDEQK